MDIFFFFVGVSESVETVSSVGMFCLILLRAVLVITPCLRSQAWTIEEGICCDGSDICIASVMLLLMANCVWFVGS